MTELANPQRPAGAATPSPSSPARVVEFDIDGMTCAACVTRVEKALAKVPGVARASVNLATECARVESDAAVETVQVTDAVRKAGYEATLVADAGAGAGAAAQLETPVATPHTTELELAIGGMTCASCATRVEKALAKVPGVARASVNLATEPATVHSSAASTHADADALIAAVTKAGYEATLIAPPVPADALDTSADAISGHTPATTP